MMLLLFTGVFAQDIEDVRRITKSYKATSGTTIEVSNKYGMIHIGSWDKDSVKIEIEMIARGKNQKKLMKVKEGIDFKFVHSQHYIIVRSVFEGAGRNLLRDFTGAVIPNADESVEINYQVYLPRKCNLEVDNKYGDVYTDDLDGNIEITIAYGNLKAHNFSGNTEINLSFGDADINEIKAGRITLNYSDIDIEKAGRISMTTKSSEVCIEDVQSLRINSRRDKYMLRKVGTLNGSSSFSTLTVTLLSERVYSDLKYGSIDVKKVGSDFSRINVNSKYTDVFLNFPPESRNYEIEMTYTKTRVVFPRTLKNVKNEMTDKRDEIYKMTGVSGSQPKPEGRIIINAVAGEVVIYHQ
jgi:hypothetical protein